MLAGVCHGALALLLERAGKHPCQSIGITSPAASILAGNWVQTRKEFDCRLAL